MAPPFRNGDDHFSSCDDAWSYGPQIVCFNQLAGCQALFLSMVDWLPLLSARAGKAFTLERQKVNAACKLAPEKTNHSRRDELIEEHLPLVKAIATSVRKTLPAHIELDDLIHAGLAGLFDAATKYRDDKQVAFATYAQYRIRGTILDSLRQMDCASRETRKRYKKMEAATREFTARCLRKPSETELAAEMGIDCQELRAWMLEFRALRTADVHGNDGEDKTNEDVPSASADRPDQVFARRQMQQRLGLAMGLLPKRYQRVLELYYQAELTMREIAQMLGVNESRISQIHKAALRRMQEVLGECGIRSATAFC